MKKNKGVIALTSILIVGALVLLIAVGVSLRSISEINMSLDQESSKKALFLANLCSEQALMKLKKSLNYSGNESIIIGQDTCSILPVEGIGNSSRIIKTQSTFSKYTKKVKIVIQQVNPLMKILSWNEVGDF